MLDVRRCLNHLVRKYKFVQSDPADRARASPPGAKLQQLYVQGDFANILAQVEARLPKDAAGNFIAEQERSGVVHDLLAFLAEWMLEMNKQKQTKVKGFLPLREHIRQTDKLIDALVYELYGLTEDEIKIVEGSTK